MKIAFLFPGQGAQYQGMGKEFIMAYPTAKRTFEEADDILGRKLSDIILNGPEDILTETKNSQSGIYVVSIAILRVLKELFPHLKPDFCAGLSLGEYTAATAAGYLTFESGLQLVNYRGLFMNDACKAIEGTMAVILGLEPEAVEAIVRDANLPNDLWIANLNCPGQIVISGTMKGIKVGTDLAKQRGAKKILPLKVHGAFHSGLMRTAKERLIEYINQVKLHLPASGLIMNVSGELVRDEDEIRSNLLEQITSPVRWEQGIRKLEFEGIRLYLEVGPGETLATLNKRIGVTGTTVSIGKSDDLRKLEQAL